jgi:hypothetical protein
VLLSCILALRLLVKTATAAWGGYRTVFIMILCSDFGQILTDYVDVCCVM